MNVKQLNELLLKGEHDRQDMWPRILEYESKSNPFFFEFGIRELPKEPGVLVIRGPRQYGKSTWLDLQIRDTIEDYGKGTALYLNGDSLLTEEALYSAVCEHEGYFRPGGKVRRLFIDEITAVPHWERAIKRAYDEGLLRKTLVVTTGSKAADLRRGNEKLPGRKGTLAKTEFVFLPISYHQFYKTCGKELGEDAWKAYLLGGGAPLACNEISQFERIPEYFPQLIREWILGDIVSLGRSRLYLRNILNAIYLYAGQPVGFAKLAREAGLANNTVASGYIEQLADLLSVMSVWPWDANRSQLLFRKPCKFAFINMAVALAFEEYSLRTVHDFDGLPLAEQGKLLEQLVAQELWRRRIFLGKAEPEALAFWQSKTHEIDYVVAGAKTQLSSQKRLCGIRNLPSGVGACAIS
ncbi:MAG: ATP-binding protein [Deltaproteobacteria bacterium]|nr:ATP-binding protein [Deltaproteobacteria bacterium]MBI3295387.1 ATP-binding protein [Deltaproteobacteria bacterium]